MVNNPLAALAMELAAHHHQPIVFGPGGMLRQMTFRQFKQWLTYTLRDPIGDRRADLRMQAHAALLMSIVGGRKALKTMPPYYKGERMGPQGRKDWRPMTSVDKWELLKKNMRGRADVGKGGG